MAQRFNFVSVAPGFHNISDCRGQSTRTTLPGGTSPAEQTKNKRFHPSVEPVAAFLCASQHEARMHYKLVIRVNHHIRVTYVLSLSRDERKGCYDRL